MSIVLSFSSIGGAIFSPIFTGLITNFGWAPTYRIMGVLSLLFALPAILLNYTLDPRESGYLPYGAKEDGEEATVFNGETLENNQELYKIPYGPFLLLLVFGLFQTMLTGIPQHFPGYAESIGLSINIGASLVSTAMVSSIGFKLLIGYISDYIGPLRGTTIMLVLTGIGSVVLLLFENVPLLFIGSFIFGAVYTLPSVATTLLTRHFFGIYLFQKLYPSISFATSIGGAFAMSAIAYIYDYTGSYKGAFIISILFVLIDTAIIFYINYRMTKLRK